MLGVSSRFVSYWVKLSSTYFTVAKHIAKSMFPSCCVFVISSDRRWCSSVRKCLEVVGLNVDLKVAFELVCSCTIICAFLQLGESEC